MVIKTGNARTWLFRLFKTEPSWKQWHCLAINGPFSSHGVVTRLNFRWQILQCVAFKNWFTLINDSGKPVIIMPICRRSILKPGFYKSSMFSLQHKIIKLVYANALVCVMTTVAVGKQDCLHTTLSLSKSLEWCRRSWCQAELLTLRQTETGEGSSIACVSHVDQSLSHYCTCMQTLYPFIALRGIHNIQNKTVTLIVI